MTIRINHYKPKFYKAEVKTKDGVWIYIEDTVADSAKEAERLARTKLAFQPEIVKEFEI